MVVSEKELFWNIVLAVYSLLSHPTLLKQEVIVAVQYHGSVLLAHGLQCPGFSDHHYPPEGFAQTHVHESVIVFDHLKQEVAGPK